MRAVVSRSSLVVGFLFISSTVVMSDPQAPAETRPEVQQHIRDLISGLPANGVLVRLLVSGARGNGIHQVWMDDMRGENIKRAVVWIGIRFDRHGKPKRMRVDRIEYFTQYENGRRVSETEHLTSIRAHGLEQDLSALALRQAVDGLWVDVPRPRPRPFIGATQIEFFDDEWLPTLGRPWYCAGASCLPGAN
jgi:hypothetical protein